MVEVYIASPVLPCSGWDIEISACCPGVTGISEDLALAGLEYGAFTVWAATGRRFGLCPRTVRPCGRDCSNTSTYGYYWSEGTWLPYIFNGAWRNCFCGCNGLSGCCTCEPACQLYLPGPVHSIISVTQDDVVVDPATYRVDNGKWLVRTHDESSDDCWLQCQDYNLNSGPNTLFVNYFVGIPVPNILKRAAGELACEWIKSCLGLPCRLPQRVTSVSRQGVTISMVNVEDLLRHGLTGVQSVDQIIRNFNPSGLVSKMGIASPDDPVTRTTTWP
jgi:hypothetical protein